jgi:hypothetical protein
MRESGLRSFIPLMNGIFVDEVQANDDMHIDNMAKYKLRMRLWSTSRSRAVETRGYALERREW